MPKILSYTPAWIARPSPGSQIFSGPPSATSSASPSKRSSQLSYPIGDKAAGNNQGRRSLIASRGTEIFTAVGNKIRWADLSTLKDDWEEQKGAGKLHKSIEQSDRPDAESAPYRVRCTNALRIRETLTLLDPLRSSVPANTAACHLAIKGLPCFAHRAHRSYCCTTRCQPFG